MDQQPIGVQRVNLRTIHPHLTNSVIIGVIIGKQQHRVFSGKSNGPNRGVWNFTLRDSEFDYINATCWGSAEFAEYLDKTFFVGDVVDVSNAKIEIRHIDDDGERYRPAVTSPFNLVLNEKISQIIKHVGDNYDHYQRFLNYPTKPISGCLRLADIKNNGDKIKGDFVDILVIVKIIKPMRTINLKKDGTEKNIRDIIVFDKSDTEMCITFWEQDYIQRAGDWKVCETVLMMTDMKVDWSNFHKSYIAQVTCRTIITENPPVNITNELREYVKTAPLTTTTYLDDIAMKFTQIHDAPLMTCQQAVEKAKLEFDSTLPNEKYFLVQLHAFVLQLDLDGYTKIISAKCGKCNSLIRANGKQCTNPECPASSEIESSLLIAFFDIPIILADNTKTLKNVRLSGKTAEKVLGVTIQDFLRMDEYAKERLKWKFLLSKCKVHVVVFKDSKVADPFALLISCEKMDNQEPHFSQISQFSQF